MNIIENIRLSRFRYLVNHKAKRTAHFPQKGKPLQVLLLYESDILEKNPNIKEIIRNLQHEQHQVTAWGYYPYKQPQSPILPQSRMIGNKDLTLLHNLQQPLREELANNRYDLLIDLTQNYCLPLHYAAFYANADFKAGRNHGFNIHDLMIEMPANENPTLLYDQITHYLQTINSND